MQEAAINRTAAANGVAAETKVVPPSRRRVSRRVIMLAVLAVALVAGGYYGLQKYRFSQNHVDTDDAQVDGHISPVLPRVAGYVTSVSVADNQRVKDGDLIATIDPREFELKVQTAEAAYRTAESGLQTAQASLGNALAALTVAQANVKSSEIARTKASDDYTRDKDLYGQSIISRQQYDASRVAAESAAAQLETVRRQVQSAEAQVKIAQAQVETARTGLAQRQADIDAARLQLSYTRIPAPSSGVVSKLNVEVGQFVQAGQPLMAIAEDSTIWVTANFKETDLKDIHPGEPVEITVDTYPGVTFQGRVESLAGATGAKFSLLPPDNATGNFVKVTQRLPVRIQLDGAADPAHPLRPGMSADVVITVGNANRGATGRVNG